MLAFPSFIFSSSVFCWKTLKGHPSWLAEFHLFSLSISFHPRACAFTQQGTTCTSIWTWFRSIYLVHADFIEILDSWRCFRTTCISTFVCASQLETSIGIICPSDACCGLNSWENSHEISVCMCHVTKANATLQC